MMKFTKWFIWVCMTIIIGVDIYLAANGKPGDTISELTIAHSYLWQTIPFSYGILTGHLFWPFHGDAIAHKWLKIAILWVMLVGMVVWDYFDMMNIIPIIPTLIFIPVGRLLWPQHVSKNTPLIAWRPNG